LNILTDINFPKVVESEFQVQQGTLQFMLGNDNVLEACNIWIIKHYKYNLTNEFYGDSPL